MIRRLAPLSLALVAGCLYTGSRNDPPGIQLIVGPDTGYRGQLLDVSTQLTDDQDDRRLLAARVALRLLDDHGQPVDSADQCLAQLIPTQAGSANLTIYRPGRYVLSATTSDVRGATAATEQAITIVDSPPLFSADATPKLASLRNLCGSYTAGQGVVLGLDGTVSDRDADPNPDHPACGESETLVYTWRATATPAGAMPRLGPLVDGGCPGAPADGSATLVVTDPTAQICVYGDPLVGDSTTTVELGVSDGVNDEVFSPGAATVSSIADQPACISGSEPGLGDQVVDREGVQSFQITGVIDDLDPFASSQLHYVWSVWLASDPVWREVADHDQADYQLDTHGYDVGEQVQVRVEAVDRTGVRATCAATDDICAADSCLVSPSNSCQRWITWTLELR